MSTFFETDWEEPSREPPVGFVKVITVGRGDRGNNTPGFWSAELIWLDEEGELHYLPLGGSIMGMTHVWLDLFAALTGIRQASDIGLPIEVHSTVQSNVDTFGTWWAMWEANERAGRGFRTNQKKIPENLDLLRQIQTASAGCSVTWTKRLKDQRDGLKQFEQMREFQRQQAAGADAMERARRRD